MIKSRIDALSNEQKKDRDAVFGAMGVAVEDYIKELLAQLTIVVGPTPGLQTTTTPGNPTGPAAAPVPLIPPPGGYFK
jgi:hypothetical protein